MADLSSRRDSNMGSSPRSDPPPDLAGPIRRRLRRQEFLTTVDDATASDPEATCSLPSTLKDRASLSAT